MKFVFFYVYHWKFRRLPQRSRIYYVSSHNKKPVFLEELPHTDVYSKLQLPVWRQCYLHSGEFPVFVSWHGFLRKGSTLVIVLSQFFYLYSNLNKSLLKDVLVQPQPI